jgi:hypothetical protein
MDYIHPHQHIVIKELSWPAAIGVDTPDQSSEVNQYVNMTGLFEQ